MPPPLMQRCLSPSRAHEKGCVTSGPLRSSFLGGMEGGVQVAEVNMSTALRTKKRGNVPPRLETLDLY